MNPTYVSNVKKKENVYFKHLRVYAGDVIMTSNEFVKRVGKVLTGGRSDRLNKIFLIYWEYIETGGEHAN